MTRLALLGLGLLLSTTGEVRTYPIDSPQTAPVLIYCPKGQSTRIVFPDALKHLEVRPAEGQDALGVTVEKSRPLGVIRILPVQHPFKARLIVRGKTVSQVIDLQTSAGGVGSEIRLQLRGSAAVVRPSPTSPPLEITPTSRPRRSAASAVARSTAATATSRPTSTATATRAPTATVTVTVTKTPTPTSTSTARPTATSTPTSTSTPRPTASSTSRPSPTEVRATEPQDALTAASPSAGPHSDGAVDFKDLGKAESRKVNRREGQPGQRVCVWDTMARKDDRMWFRFRLQGGAAVKLAGVEGDSPAALAWEAYVDGGDLGIVVQADVSAGKAETLILRFTDGSSYKFRLKDNNIFNSFLRNWL